MKPFSFEKKLDADVLRIKISGYIDEYAKFPPQIDFAKKIVIDLGGAEGINSIGTKSWCHWMESMKPPLTIEVENCPVIFVKTFNTILGAHPKNLTVKSFFVPYLSTDGAGKRKDVLFRVGVEVLTGGQINPPQIKDENGNEMEMDVHPLYFNFAKK